MLIAQCFQRAGVARVRQRERQERNLREVPEGTRDKEHHGYQLTGLC